MTNTTVKQIRKAKSDKFLATQKKASRDYEFQCLYDRAHAEAVRAVRDAMENKQIAAMVVEQHSNVFDDNSPVTQSWFVADGPCGFAWINVRPGTSSFAKWLLATKKAHSAYKGGVDIWVRDFGQSEQKKAIYAGTFARVLCAAGIKSYANSRLD